MRRFVLTAVVLLVLVPSAGGVERAATGRLAVDWQRVEPGGATRCARGGKYAFWIRKADPKKLLVFFQGGGGCFDVTTCEPGSVWFDDRVDASDDPTTAGGILELERSDNPFRDYSIVYIPSCTGDVHTGTRVVTYGPHRVHQKGSSTRGRPWRARTVSSRARARSSLPAAAPAASDRPFTRTRSSSATRRRA